MLTSASPRPPAGNRSASSNPAAAPKARAAQTAPPISGQRRVFSACSCSTVCSIVPGLPVPPPPDKSPASAQARSIPGFSQRATPCVTNAWRKCRANTRHAHECSTGPKAFYCRTRRRVLASHSSDGSDIRCIASRPPWPAALEKGRRALDTGQYLPTLALTRRNDQIADLADLQAGQQHRHTAMGAARIHVRARIGIDGYGQEHDDCGDHPVLQGRWHRRFRRVCARSFRYKLFAAVIAPHCAPCRLLPFCAGLQDFARSCRAHLTEMSRQPCCPPLAVGCSVARLEIHE